METILKVKGMHCNSCKILIEDAISAIPGVSKVSADYKAGKVSIVFSQNPLASVAVDKESLLPKIKQAIISEGYKVD